MGELQLGDVHFAYSDQPIVQGLTWKIETGRRYGLVGRNGCGKTTLLRLMAAELQPDKGRVMRPRGSRLVYLRQQAQEIMAVPTLLDAMLLPFEELRDSHRELRELEERLGREPNDPVLLDRYGGLQQRYEQQGGYTYEGRIREVLGGLGFRPDDLVKPTRVLSGGERNRAALAQVLLSEPDFLLLDEPTDHLDIQGTEWLERHLNTCNAGVVVVSHDRRFLDRTVNRVLELERTRGRLYLGGYSDYMREKKLLLERESRAYELEQTEIRRQEEFIRRHIAGQKTKQAQSRRKLLERMDRRERPVEDQRRMALRLASQGRAGREVVRLEGVGHGFEGRRLFQEVEAVVYRGEKVALVGPNGSGKTTLLRILAGRVPPETGQITWGHNVRPVFYDQTERSLDPTRSVLDALWDVHPEIEPGRLRSHLARFLFSGESVFRSVGALSGGEQARLVMARMVLDPANLLVLDEPTNHLDIPAREVLERELAGYPGTLLLVSHDRVLLEAVAQRVWSLESGRMVDYPTGYSEVRQQQEAEPARTEIRPVEGDRRRSKRELRQERAERRARRGESPTVLERRIEELEAELPLLEERESDPAIQADWQRLQEIHQERQRIELEIEALLARWESAMEEGL